MNHLLSLAITLSILLCCVAQPLQTRGEEPETGAAVRIPHLEDIRIDGRSEDWGGSGFRVAVMHRRPRLSVQVSPSAEADLRIGWQENGIVALLRVHDEKYIEAGKPWKLDSSEWFVARVPGSNLVYQVAVAPGLDPDYPELRHEVYDHRPGKYGKLDISAVRTRTDYGYQLEIRLPWPTPDFVPEPGTSVGVQLIVNDADLSADRSDVVHTSWYPDRNTYLDSTKMQRVLLARAPGAPVVARAELRLFAEQPGLTVAALESFAGQNVTVKQRDTILGRTALPTESSLDLVRATVPLTGLDPNGAPLTVWVDKRQCIAELPMYPELSGSLQRIVNEAVNTADEKERYRLLVRLQNSPGLANPLASDLEKLLPIVDMWANGYEKAQAGELTRPDEYLCSIVSPSTPPEIRADSPVYPIFCLYRARHLIWTPIQYGHLSQNPETREEYYGTARKLLRTARRAAPDHPLIRI